MNPTLTPISSLTANSTPSTGFSTTPTQTVSQPPAIPAPVVAPKAPTVVTSAPARNETQAMVDYLASQFTYEQKQAIERQQRADAQKALDAQKKSPLYQTVSALADVNLNAKGATVTPQEGMSAAEQARLQRDADMAAVSAELSRIQASMDARTATTIENIKQEYAQLDAEQRMANKAYEAGVTTAGFVSGRSQYAPEIQMGIVKAAVDDGINKLSKIQAKKAQLINEAEAARDERNYKLLSAKMDALRENAKDERDFALKLEQNVREAAREERDAMKFQNENEKYVADSLAPFLASSITNINSTEALETIQSIADSRGISPGAIASAIQRFNAEQATSDIRNYEYALKQGFKGTKLQYERTQALNKVTSSPSTKNSAALTSAVNVYGGIIEKALAEGATPSDAVMAAAAVSKATTGTDINLETQSGLVNYAKELSGQNAQGSQSAITSFDIPGISRSVSLPGEIK